MLLRPSWGFLWFKFYFQPYITRHLSNELPPKTVYYPWLNRPYHQPGFVGNVLNVKFLRIVITCFVLSVGEVSLVQGSDVGGGIQKDSGLTLDIPGQDLNTALIEFALQANIDFIVSSDLIVGYRSAPLVGYYSLDAALALFLGHTPLRFEVRDDGIVLSTDKNKVEIEKSLAEVEMQPYSVLEEMLVTSRRREEALLDVPMSVVAVGGDELESKGISDFFRFGLVTPNLTVSPVHGTNSTMTAFIRGVGQYDSYAGFESGVGIYIDDVYINRPQGMLAELYDTERIEVLRGPQGTLYGRNSVGGAIKYVSKPLPNVASASLELSSGSYGQSNIVLRAGGATRDSRLKFSGTFASLNRDGFGQNIFTGNENYNKDIRAYRMSSEVSFSEQLRMSLSLDKSKDNSISRVGQSVLDDASRDQSFSAYDGFSGVHLSNHAIDKFSMEASGETIKLFWEDAGYQIKSIHAKRSDKTRNPLDLDAIREHVLEAYIVYENNQLSHEFQFSKIGENHNLVAGFYYINADAFHASDYRASNNIGFHLVDVKTRSQAVFIDAEIDLSEEFVLAAGIRYTEERNRTIIDRDVFLGGSGGDLMSSFFGGNLPSVSDIYGEYFFPQFSGVRKDHVTTPRVNLSWRPRKNLHFYSVYSKGFRGGGFDPRGSFEYSEVQDGYSPEVLNAYEVGMKSKYKNNELSVAVFLSHYDDIQFYGGVSVANQGEGIRVFGVSNDASATVKGIEIDYKYKPMRNLDVSLSLGWNDSKYNRSIDEFGDNISESVKFINLPDENAALSVAYNHSLAGGVISGVLSGSYRSETSLFDLPVEGAVQPSYWITDIGIKWEDRNRRVSIGVNAHNVFDERYKTSILYADDYDVSTVYFGDPRTITGTLRLRF